MTFMETPLNETVSVALIQMAGWPVATSGRRPSQGVFMETLCFNSHGTFKIKGRICVVSNENEIGKGKIV